MNVLVINQCSTNKGDRAVLYFVLRELKANGIDNVTVSASNPEYWHDKPDFPDMTVRVVPWGWDVSRKKSVSFWGKIFHLFCPRIVERINNTHHIASIATTRCVKEGFNCLFPGKGSGNLTYLFGR